MRTVFKTGLIMIIILVIVSCTNIALSNPTPTTVAPTEYIPVSMGTSLPLVYKPITSQTTKDITLLANWKTDLPVTGLVFASNRDLLCLGNQVVIKNWDIFSNAVVTNPKNCQVSYSQTSDALFNLNTLVYSTDHKYSAEVDSGALLLKDLTNTDRDLFLYAEGASAVEYSPSGEYLLIAFASGKVWFVRMVEIVSLLNKEKTINYVSELSPDLVIDVGKAPLKIYFSDNDFLMAFMLDDQTIQVWDVPSLSLISTIYDHVPPLPQNSTQSSSNDLLRSRFAFSPNNELIAIAYTENNISYVRLWDIKTGESLVTLQGCQGRRRISALAFSPTNRALAALYDGVWICVWGILPDNLDEAKAVATTIAESTLNSTVAKASFPRPTLTPTSGLPAYQSQISLAWSVPMPTREQIKEARDCSVEFLATSRYPEKMSYGELEKAYPLKSSCEWAALAFAYRAHFKSKDSVPEEGKRAFFETIRQNPAFAMNMSLFYAYFNSMKLVSAPPLASQPIKSVVIDYEWNGMGEPSNIQYHIEIDNVNSSVDQMKINVQAQPKDLTNNLARTLDPQNVQEIGKALTDFLPVQSSFTLQNCTDNYPDWNIKLTFLDGTVQIIKTHESNFFDAGGPWFMELNGQNYVQFSSALVNSALGLFERLNLPLGQPSATFCSSKDIFGLAYP